MDSDCAIIQQLIPMLDRWEFHYLRSDVHVGEFNTHLEVIPMLGLALIDFPAQDGDTSRRIVHFGQGDDGSDSFDLYTPSAWHGSRFLYPFFQNSPYERALGIAPAKSSPDFFADEIKEASDQLEGEHLFGHKLGVIYRASESHPWSVRDAVDTGIDKYFKMKSDKYRYDASKAEWELVTNNLIQFRAENGDGALIEMLRDVSKIPNMGLLLPRSQTVPV